MRFVERHKLRFLSDRSEIGVPLQTVVLDRLHPIFIDFFKCI
jgi:hypothetical protein